ncbi:MAG: hypothetical protein ACOX3R_00425 [Desulfitobacteriia bacterium]|jgi:hypothetical protein
MQTFRPKAPRTISLRTAVFLLLAALLIQYLWLEGSALAANARYYSRYAFPVLSPAWEFKEYRLAGYQVSLEVPENTAIIVTPDQGEDMRFNIYFTNDTLAFRGYIQLWKIKDLESFLKKSKALSPFDFIYYQLNALIQDHKEGFTTEWSADFGDSRVSGREYWLKTDSSEEVLRLSFFTESADFPEGLKPVTQKVLASLRVAKAP